MKRLFMVVAAGLAVAACDEGVSGTYAGNENSFLEKLEFKSDKVDVTGMGQTKQGTYEIDGEKIIVTISGEAQVFTRDSEGCLDGGMLLGKYCKN